MAKRRGSLSSKNPTGNSRKTKKRLAIKKAMLEERAAKKK